MTSEPTGQGSSQPHGNATM